MKNPKRLAAAAVTAAFLIPLAVLGAPALASSQQASSSQYEYGTTKVTVCHHTGSAKHPWVKITISLQGWLHGHSKHGHDFQATGSTPCPPVAATTASTTGSTSNGHGNGNGHGNSGNDSNSNNGNSGHENNGHHNKP
jgi:hypothetical protein